MATLVLTPSQVPRGKETVITGEGYLPSTVVTISIPAEGVQSEVMSDEGGSISSDDLPNRATALLTSTGVNVTAGDTVTIDGVVYTFAAAPGATANAVLIGASAAASLTNLKSAINLDGTPVYGTATVVHPTVAAGALTATTLALYAKTGGVAGNSLGSTEAAVTLSFGGATFSGGSATTGVSPIIFKSEEVGTKTITATDGTNTASASLKVFS